MDDRGIYQSSLATRIATLVHAHFDALPARCKPRSRPDGTNEWIPMSGIVLAKGDAPEKLTCVAIATGARCLYASQIPQCRGLVLHDSHAEILALRALNLWLINECMAVLREEQEAKVGKVDQSHMSERFVRRRQDRSENDHWPPFELCSDVKIYMYCTCCPCGDASMELCMAAQDDPTPWEMSAEFSDADPEAWKLAGRANFSILGVVRRKPARADAEPSLSKSCSDKLSLRQVMSILSYPASLLVAPTENAYITGLIMPEDEINSSGCSRAFGMSGRMKSLAGKFWLGDSAGRYGYRFRPFEILSVPSAIAKRIWPYRKPHPDEICQAEGRKPPKPGNISAVWIASNNRKVEHSYDRDHMKWNIRLNSETTGVLENIISGVKQGNKYATVTPRGASALSRAKLWDSVLNVFQFLKDMEDSCEESSDWLGILQAQTYAEFKRPQLADNHRLRLFYDARASALRDVRQVLRPWPPNHGDESWSRVEVLTDPKAQKTRIESSQ